MRCRPHVRPLRRPDSWPRRPVERGMLILAIAVLAGFASPATGEMVYVFEGTATSAYERVFRVCGQRACDDPSPIEPTDVVQSEIVRDFQDVTFRVAFVVDPGREWQSPSMTWESEWLDNSRTLNAASVTTTTTTTFADPGLNTVVVESESTVQDHGPLYRNSISGLPSFEQKGAQAFFIPSSPAFAREVVEGGTWRWTYAGPDIDPYSLRLHEPVTYVSAGDIFRYRTVDFLQQPEYEIRIEGIADVTLTAYPGAELPPAPPLPQVPVASWLGTTLIAASIMEIGRRARSQSRPFREAEPLPESRRRGLGQAPGGHSCGSTSSS